MDESTADLLHRLVYDLDRAADQLLRAHFGLSFSRARFLLRLQLCGTITQHDLALALGYSDPAVSTMLQGLTRDGYVQTAPSPDHGRKRLVSLTAKGTDFVNQGRQLLNDEFSALAERAGLDLQHYTELTQKLHATLKSKESPHER